MGLGPEKMERKKIRMTEVLVPLRGIQKMGPKNVFGDGLQLQKKNNTNK